jgi:hypothetical protein
MKFIRSQKSGLGGAAFLFEMSRQEMDWLVATLKLYPQLDSGYHQITHCAAPEIKAEQELLEEAMAQQRGDHKRKLDKFFATPGRFRLEGPGRYRFSLPAEQMDWMLQVLNDVRVGSWVKLGRPELESVPKPNLTGQAARAMAALEISGYFQMVLLEACKAPESA